MEKRTFKVQVKQGHRLYAYFEDACEKAKNIHNATNFHIRQAYTALTSGKPLQELQRDVLDAIRTHLPQMNETQQEAYEKRLAAEQKKPAGKRKEVKLNLFSFPTAEKAFLSYNFLDCFFKTSKNPDYLALPTQSAQATMRKVCDDWSSFFEGLKAFQADSSAFTGQPRIPQYKRGLKEAYFSNQDCVFKDGAYLKFPKTKERLNIGKLGIKGTLKQVRVIPRFGAFIVELVMDAEVQEAQVLPEDRVMAIDLGVNNLAAVVTNTGMEPCIFNGRPLKSVNQFYNMKRAHYFGVLRQGHDPKNGKFRTERLDALDKWRHNKTADYCHKVSRAIVDMAIEERVSKIVVGKNDGWKREVQMRKKDKQHFLFLSHQTLIDMLTYKAQEAGIEVVVREESYTSKASCLDNDPIPTYGDQLIPAFSGRRIKRGLYKSKQGILINADINAAFNILRKAFPNFWNGIAVPVGAPRMLSVV